MTRCGAAAALGVRFIDANGEDTLPLGGTLDEVVAIDTSLVPANIREVEFICLCDVKSTLTGESGAARMFAPQKGASEKAVELLEANAIHMQDVILRDLGIDLSNLEGGGAAGGFGAGAVAFLGATIRGGIDEILTRIGFENALEDADAVITGEGRADEQSSKGKAVNGVISVAKRREVPVIVVAGSAGNTDALGADAVFSTVTDFCTFDDVKADAKENLRRTAKSIASVLAVGAKKV